MRQVSQAELLSIMGNAPGVEFGNCPKAFIKQSLRRAAFQLAPCSYADIIRFVYQPLALVGVSKEVVEELLDTLIAFGDVLEMRRLDSDPWDAPDVILRPAPPSFVIRQNGDAIIIGVAGDMLSPLPHELDSAVDDNGPVRILRVSSDDLPSQLKGLGLLCLSEAIWLRTPSIVTAQAYLQKWRYELSRAASLGEPIEGLEILDVGKATTYYRGRWTYPTAHHSGIFVSRRPQKYGANLWSLVELQGGAAKRLIDFPRKLESARQCDLAWRVQAALDKENNAPQRFRVTQKQSETTLDFFSPLPSFAERRLNIYGSKSSGQNCLYRYTIPNQHSTYEVAHLEALLWLEAKYERGQ